MCYPLASDELEGVMKTTILWVILALTMVASASAADVQLYHNGKNTYGSDGTAYHRTPTGGIVPWGNNAKNTTEYHQYGTHLYGSDGSWRAKHGKTITGNLPHGLHSSDAVVNDLFGKSWHEGGGHGGW